MMALNLSSSVGAADAVEAGDKVTGAADEASEGRGGGGASLYFVNRLPSVLVSAPASLASTALP